MPIYAYHCAACGYEFDVLQKLSDPVLTECPRCGKPALHKMVTAAAFELKGSGWYATDFADKKPAPPAREDAPAKPTAAAKSATAATADAAGGDARVHTVPPACHPAKPVAPAAGCGPACSCH